MMTGIGVHVRPEWAFTMGRNTQTGETLATIARAVEAERHCCRFLRFGITVEPDGGPVFLELTGPPGTWEFIRALLEV